MKKIHILLLLLPLVMKSQSFIGFTIGDKIINEHIYIINDSLESKVSVFDDGYCYRIETKFKETNRDEIDYVKQFVNTDKEWESGYLKSSDLPYESEYNRDEPFDGGSFMATVTDKGIKYLIFHDEGRYNEREPGLILVEKKEDISKIPGIAKKVMNSVTGAMSFKSYEDCISSPIFKEKKAAWESTTSTPVEKIELPYKFNFGMTHQQITNHFKTILEKNSVLKSEPMNGNKTDTQIGVTNCTYIVKTNNAHSFSVEVKFLNGKAVDYNYLHDYELDQKLREKIKGLKEKYITVGTTFGNNIYDVKSIEKIQQLKENYRNKGNLGSKM